jgi:hypothetical protein
MRRGLITGSSGLIGSEVHSVDNNLRREFFGADGDTL